MTDTFCCLTRLLLIYTLILVETGFPVFILKEFHTCDVSSATGVTANVYVRVY